MEMDTVGRTLVELRLEDGTTRRFWGHIGEHALACHLESGALVDRLVVDRAHEFQKATPLHVTMADLSRHIEKTFEHADEGYLGFRCLIELNYNDGSPFTIKMAAGAAPVAA